MKRPVVLSVRPENLWVGVFRRLAVLPGGSACGEELTEFYKREMISKEHPNAGGSYIYGRETKTKLLT